MSKHTLVINIDIYVISAIGILVKYITITIVIIIIFQIEAFAQ